MVWNVKNLFFRAPLINLFTLTKTRGLNNLINIENKNPKIEKGINKITLNKIKNFL